MEMIISICLLVIASILVGYAIGVHPGNTMSVKSSVTLTLCGVIMVFAVSCGTRMICSASAEPSTQVSVID